MWVKYRKCFLCRIYWWRCIFSDEKLYIVDNETFWRVSLFSVSSLGKGFFSEAAWAKTTAFSMLSLLCYQRIVVVFYSKLTKWISYLFHTHNNWTHIPGQRRFIPILRELKAMAHWTKVVCSVRSIPMCKWSTILNMFDDGLQKHYIDLQWMQVTHCWSQAKKSGIRDLAVALSLYLRSPNWAWMIFKVTKEDRKLLLWKNFQFKYQCSSWREWTLLYSTHILRRVLECIEKKQ